MDEYKRYKIQCEERKQFREEDKPLRDTYMDKQLDIMQKVIRNNDLNAEEIKRLKEIASAEMRENR